MVTETGLSVTYRGVKYPVTLDEWGKFNAVVEGHDLKSDRLTGLDEQAAKIPRKRIEVPFIRVIRSNNADTDPKIYHGNVTGRHIDGRTLLVRWENGKSDQIKSYQAGDLLPALTQAQEMELMARLEIEQAAGVKVAELLNGYRALPGVETMVAAALAEAISDE